MLPSPQPNPPPRRATRTRGRAATLIAVLGIGSAVALGFVGAMDLGDPRIRAMAAAQQAAEASVESLELRWERLLGEVALPAAVTAWQVRFGPAASSLAPPKGEAETESVPPDASGEARVTELLVDAALSASGAGELERAGALIEEALALCQGGPSHVRAVYTALRLAAGNGDAVGPLRDALLGQEDDLWVEGASAKLLACLVEPVDATGAWELVTDPLRVLPAPEDRIGPAFEFVPDPWWLAVRDRLRAAAPARDWAGALRERDRHGAAVRARLAGEPAESWTFERHGDALVAHRRDGDGWTVAGLDAAALRRELAGPRREARIAFEVDAEASGGQVVLQGAPLPGTGALDLAYSVVHWDPLAAALPELRRQRVVRFALFALAALIALAALVAARSLRRAARLTELRSTFVASVSHDLRTPTQAILLMAETLEQSRVATEESRARYHTQIRREAQRMRRLVEDLLDGARIDRGGGARIERSRVELGPFLDDLEAALGERADAAGAALSFTRERMPRSGELDADSVYRAVWNLVENALIHAQRGDAPPTVRVRMAHSMGALQVTVEDDGPGIHARHRESVFGAFERLADRRAGGTGLEHDTGTGLGLAIVRSISRAHGGDAYLAPSASGARFVATFGLETGPGEEEVA